MPGVATFSGPRILERLELQAMRWQADGAAIRQQPLAIGGDQVGHGFAAPDMAMQPEPPVHRVNHPVTWLPELAPRIRVVAVRQEMRGGHEGTRPPGR